jgi:hypothetical protein
VHHSISEDRDHPTDEQQRCPNHLIFKVFHTSHQACLCPSTRSSTPEALTRTISGRKGEVGGPREIVSA